MSLGTKAEGNPVALQKTEFSLLSKILLTLNLSTVPPLHLHISVLFSLPTHAQVAAYIPQLAKSNPDLWGVSLCTVDGQR